MFTIVKYKHSSKRCRTGWNFIYLLSTVTCNHILSCKIVDSDWLRDFWWKSISPIESWNHALIRVGTWQRVILHDDGRYSKNIDYAEFLHVRFTLNSEWRRMSVWIYGVRNTNSNIHLTWIVLKPNVNLDGVFN